MRLNLIRKLHALMSELNISDMKDVLYSNYNVSSSVDMSDEQLMSLIGKLEQQKSGRAAVRSEVVNERKRAISNCMTVITRQMGFTNHWEVINPFVRGIKGNGGLTLSQMTIEELKECHKRLIMMYRNGFRYKPNNTKESVMVVNVSRFSNNIKS